MIIFLLIILGIIPIILLSVAIFGISPPARNISPISIKDENNYNNRYVKREYLLTETELKFYKQLKKITDELNLTICPQVTLYEILRNKKFKDFNKIQSKSIDFVITEQNLKIKLCIELDDISHYKNKRIKRDMFINKLFEDLNIKLLRIPVQNYYNLEELKNKIKESL